MRIFQEKLLGGCLDCLVNLKGTEFEQDSGVCGKV